MSPRIIVGCGALNVVSGNNQLGRMQQAYSLVFIGMRFS